MGKGDGEMFKLILRQMLAVFLAVLMLRPFPMSAASPDAVLGSISSYGAVTVGDIASPAENTLFAGDLVKTNAGSAVIQYKEGTRVLLAKNSTAQFTDSDVQLQNGQMSFRTSSDQSTVFHASSLRLEPAGSSSANVILKDQKASVNVTEGAVQVVDPTGKRLASIQAGEARLFAMAVPPASAAPAASAAAPQMGGSDGTVWLLALGVAAVGASLGIAGLVRASNANDNADAATARANAAEAQAADLLAQVNALKAQVAASQAQVAALQADIAASQAKISALEAQIATLQGQSGASQAQIAALQTQLAAAQAQLAAAQAQLTASQADIAAAQAQIADLLAQIDDLERRINEASPAIP